MSVKHQLSNPVFCRKGNNNRNNNMVDHLSEGDLLGNMVAFDDVERDGGKGDIVPEIGIKPSDSQPVFTLQILKIIKDAQQQHGLRHSDYQRYRGYCTRRIRRLRKVLHIPQGDKRHFKRRDVTDAHLKDERALYIPLMCAERAWGHAMQLRQEANTELRKRFHLIARLRKAASQALHLQKLCESEKCDARSKLEAQAYVAWIHGSLYFELKKWKPAMENLKKAQMVYESLSGALGEEDRALFRQRCEELAPSLRYCAYNIGDKTAIDDLMTLRSQAHGDLLDNLDSLVAQTREQRSEELNEMTWRGRSFPVRPERVRLFLLAERNLDTADVTSADRLEQLERHLMDCKDAVAALKEEIKADPATKSKASVSLTPLQHLLSYLTYIRLSRTIERNLLMVESAKTTLADKMEAEGRKARPQDLTRLYEIILQNLGEMQQLAGLEDDGDFQTEIESKVTFYKAFRCFHIAEVLANMRRWREASALYTRAEGYAKTVVECASMPEMAAQLAALLESIERGSCDTLARAVLEDGAEAEQAAERPAVVKGAKNKKPPLIDRLDDYCEDPSLLTKSPNIVRLPPDMNPIPCKPLFFDLAFNLLELPSLEDKIDITGKKSTNPAGITGFVKGLWGWGGSKK